MVNGMPSVEIAFSISFLRLCRRGLLPIIDREEVNGIGNARHVMRTVL